jgi:hypothetical protein
MIHFLVTETGSFSIRRYLLEEGAALAERMRVVSYEELPHMRRLPLGTWVFTELDQLDAAQLELALFTSDRLRAESAGVRLMNDPRHVRLRFDLLCAARRAGVNEHAAWPAADVLLGGGAHARVRAGSEPVSAASLRYPVFVRYANKHNGSLTALLESPRDLDDALASLAAEGVRRRELLVVEFCDTRDEHGVYRKYSAYNVGGRILPRALESGRDWMVKHRGRIFERSRADEELAYFDTNPHAEWIREMFRLGGVDYGRIDYGVLDGTPRLWEINTNPTIARGPNRDRVRPPDEAAYREMIAPMRVVFYERFQEAWTAVDTPARDGESMELALPESLARAIDRAERRRRNAERVSSLVNVVARQPWVRPVTRLVKQAVLRHSRQL